MPDLHVETAVFCRAQDIHHNHPGLVHRDEPADVARALLTHTVGSCIDDPTITPIDHHHQECSR